MQGKDFITFSGKLAAQNSIGAAGFRSATSRAYYGTFHLARELLEGHGFLCRDQGNAHLWVRRHFQNCTSQKPKEVGRLLENLAESRKDADYRLDKAYADKQENAKLCVLRADEIQKLIAECDEAGHREQIRKEMEAFRLLARMT